MIFYDSSAKDILNNILSLSIISVFCGFIFCIFAAVIEFSSCSLSLFDKHKTIINII